MTGDVLDGLRRALRQVRTDLGAGDRLRLLTFNMRVYRLVDFSQPASDIDAALASLRGAGSSAIFDALAVALTAADPPGRRRLIVLFSDGQDSSSISDVDTLIEVARRSTPTVAIILASPSAERSAALLRTTSTLASATVGWDLGAHRQRNGGHRDSREARREPLVEVPANFARATSSTSRLAASSARVRTPSRCA